MTAFVDATATAARLPYPGLVRELRALLADPAVAVPERLVQPLPAGASLFVMPALDARIAITKLITFTPGTAGSGRPAIQDPAGPLLLIGAGAQGRAHLEAFAQGLPLRRVLVASRSRASAEALAGAFTRAGR